MAAGDFSPSVLQNIMLEAEKVWAGGIRTTNNQINSVAAQAVLANQTARIRDLEDPEKDRTVRITWIDTCPQVAADCVSNCDLDEPELASLSKDYTLDLCKKTGFSVDAEKTRTNIYSVEQEAAEGIARSLKTLDEWVSQQTVVKLKAFEGINVAPNSWPSGL